MKRKARKLTDKMIREGLIQACRSISTGGHIRKFAGKGWRAEMTPLDPFVLTTDSEARKELPLFSGVLNYFPLALAAVARVSKRGNDKHNPGEPLHWARGKSMDHTDCIARHLIDVETVDPTTGEYEDAQRMAWRALAKLQELEEKRLGKPMSRGSRMAGQGMAKRGEATEHGA